MGCSLWEQPNGELQMVKKKKRERQDMGNTTWTYFLKKHKGKMVSCERENIAWGMDVQVSGLEELQSANSRLEPEIKLQDSLEVIRLNSWYMGPIV